MEQSARPLKAPLSSVVVLAVATSASVPARAQTLDVEAAQPNVPAVADTPKFPVLQAGADLFKGLYSVATLGGKVTIYGQFVPSFQSVNDGFGGYEAFLDNANSQSRIGLFSDVPLANSTLRLRAEFGLGVPKTNQSNQISDLSYTFWGDSYIRYLEARLSGDYGILTFGQGDMATNDASNNDASKTRVAGGVAIRDSAGGFFFRHTDGSLSGVQVGDVFDSFNANRRVRVLYNSPVWNGFSLAAAYGGDKRSESGTQTNYDAALNYAGSFSDIAVNASLGFARQEDDAGTRDANYVGSVAVLNELTGLNLNLASGGVPGGVGYGYIKVGWTGDPFRTGFTAVAAEYYGGQDFGAPGASSTARGLMAVQGFDDLTLEAYVAYREYAFFDPSSGPYQDIRSLLFGARWKF